LSNQLFAGFEFHPETNYLETNLSLGVGNGHVLSRDLHLLLPHLGLFRLFNCNSFIDLGSGDGYVLRIAEAVRFKTVTGVEADTALHNLATRNLTRSILHNQPFSDLEVNSLPNKIDVVYFFNPAEYGLMIETFSRVQPRGVRFLLTKNFEIQRYDIMNLRLRLFWKLGPYRLYRSGRGIFHGK